MSAVSEPTSSWDIQDSCKNGDAGIMGTYGGRDTLKSKVLCGLTTARCEGIIGAWQQHMGVWGREIYALYLDPRL